MEGLVSKNIEKTGALWACGMEGKINTLQSCSYDSNDTFSRLFIIFDEK